MGCSFAALSAAFDIDFADAGEASGAVSDVASACPHRNRLRGSRCGRGISSRVLLGCVARVGQLGSGSDSRPRRARVRAQIDHQAVRIRHKKGRIILGAVDIQHEPHSIRLVLRDADRLKHSALHAHRFSRNLGAHLRLVQVEIDALGRRDTRGFEFDRIRQADDDSRGIRRVPRLEVLHARQAVFHRFRSHLGRIHGKHLRRLIDQVNRFGLGGAFVQIGAIRASGSNIRIRRRLAVFYGLADLLQRRPRLIRSVRVRKDFQVLFVGGFSLFGLIEIVILDFRNRKHRFAAIAASRILFHQERIHRDRGLEVAGIVEPPHLHVQLRLGDQRRSRITRVRGDQVDLVKGGDRLNVVGTRSVLLEVALEHCAHLHSLRELLSGVRFLVSAGGNREAGQQASRHGKGAENLPRARF